MFVNLDCATIVECVSPSGLLCWSSDAQQSISSAVSRQNTKKKRKKNSATNPRISNTWVRIMWRRDQRAEQPSFRRSAKDRARATIRHSVLRLRLLSFKWWAPNHDNNNTKPDGYMAIRCAPEPFRRPIAECASRIFGSHALQRRVATNVAACRAVSRHKHTHTCTLVADCHSGICTERTSRTGALFFFLCLFAVVFVS